MISVLKTTMEPKYDKIGIDYNLTRGADKYLTERFLNHLKPGKKGIYLDIGCGTGNYTHALQKAGFQFIGIDPSTKMLEKARLKNRQIDWRVGTAENTQLKSKSIDGIVAMLTIHHWTDLKKGFSELSRILKADGKIVIFTSTPEQMHGYWLNHYFPNMLKDSIAQMPSHAQVEQAVENAGVQIAYTEKYSIRPDLTDHFLYCGKQNPDMYFIDEVRNGISSFSFLSNRKEVTQGLKNLRMDISSGKIKEVISSYENNFGDYLFVVAETFQSSNTL